MHHTIARNAADGEYTKKFVARNVAEVGRDSTAAILRAILRATNFGVDTRRNSAIARNIGPPPPPPPPPVAAASRACPHGRMHLLPLRKILYIVFLNVFARNQSFFYYTFYGNVTQQLLHYRQQVS